VAAVRVGELVEAADRWLVPVVGLTVTQCRLDYAYTLVLAGEDEGSFYVTIEQAFSVAASLEVEGLVVDPERDPVQVAPALRVLRQDVERAVAFKDGRLELTFGDGAVLRAPASEDYESWNIVGPAGLRLVSLPGGELAVWSPEAGQDR
jgi:hypothetical protein